MDRVVVETLFPFRRFRITFCCHLWRKGDGTHRDRMKNCSMVRCKIFCFVHEPSLLARSVIDLKRWHLVIYFFYQACWFFFVSSLFGLNKKKKKTFQSQNFHFGCPLKQQLAIKLTRVEARGRGRKIIELRWKTKSGKCFVNFFPSLFRCHLWYFPRWGWNWPENKSQEVKPSTAGKETSRNLGRKVPGLRRCGTASILRENRFSCAFCSSTQRNVFERAIKYWTSERSNMEHVRKQAAKKDPISSPKRWRTCQHH